MFLRTVELAFARFQAGRDARALAIVFDRTAPELLRLARHLGSAEADAEDLVQSTFLQAIEIKSQHRRGEPVLPWLLGILVNQARMARRRARRPLDGARLRTDSVRDPRDEAVGNELGATVTTAIDQLPEAYRPVLRMWLELGLQAQEIARTLERPAGTVRAQISRGLELLRKALPVGVASSAAFTLTAGRGLAAVRTHVLALCPGTSIGLGATLALGGLLVLHHKLVALAAGALVVLGGWWAFLGEPPLANIGEAASSGQAAATSVSVPAVAATAPDDEAENASRVAATAPAELAAVSATTGELVVELVDTTGRPLPGMGVAVQHSDDLASFAHHSDWLRTDSSGIARFTDLRPASWHIDLDRMGGIAAGAVIAGQTTHRRVEVAAGVRVEGVVLDRNDHPVAGATVVVHGNRLAAPVVAISDAAGRFAADHVLPKLDLQARFLGHSPSPVQSVGGNAGTTVAMTLRLGEPGRRIAGRAVDHNGERLARAKVAIVAAAAANVNFWDRDVPQTRPLYLTTDGDGAFVTEEAGRDQQLVLLQPRDAAVAACWQFVAAGAEATFLELRAERGAVLTGRVVGGPDAEGISVQVMCHAARPIGFLANLIAVRATTTGPDGTYRLDGLLAGQTEVIARRVFQTVAQTELSLTAGAETGWDIDLAPAQAALALRVVVRSPLLPERLLVMVRPHTPDNRSPQLVELDVDGRARFDVNPTQNVAVSVLQLAGGRAMVELARRDDLPPNVGEVTFDLMAEQLPARSVRGRLVDGAGAPVANELVAFSRNDQSGLIVRVEATTMVDGVFASPPVPTGTYRVSMGGAFAMERELARAVLTIDRDADLGNLQVGK